MKTLLLLASVCVAAAAWTGCGRDEGSSAKSTNAAGGNPLTAPADYLGAAAKAKQSSEKVIDTIAINQAISLFHTSEGRFPRDLNELVTEKYMPRLPEAPYGMKIEYDAARGQVKIVAK
ncbi:MAG: hypothetical protein KJ072_23310 [Verrucomicrobia bacterium]|nr:hypothetical protein [Verrucomicrobiota bacterium]